MTLGRQSSWRGKDNFFCIYHGILYANFQEFSTMKSLGHFPRNLRKDFYC